MVPKINELTAKTVFTKSGLPGSDWVINPYNGCLFGCMYCYAAQIARWKHPSEQWGTYLDVKTNAPEVLANFGYEGAIAIQTKSPLVTKDIGVLERFKNVTVGFTITSLDDKISQFLEINAPTVTSRIKALKELHDNNIST